LNSNTSLSLYLLCNSRIHVITLYSGHECVYYASMLRCWHLVWILVRTKHPSLGVGCHTHALLCIPRVRLHAGASLLLDADASFLHDVGASLLPHDASLLLHGGAVRTTLLLRRWVHTSTASSKCSSSANPLSLSFPLPL
jgi:hypothetical protein